MDGAEQPTISLETNSSLSSYFICSTKSPSKAYFFNVVLIPLIDVLLFNSKLRIAKDPLGTGTRIALEVNLPSRLGNALATALPAPVSVITIFNPAALPRRYLL